LLYVKVMAKPGFPELHFKTACQDDPMCHALVVRATGMQIHDVRGMIATKTADVDDGASI
jgi:hypothetical protein